MTRLISFISVVLQSCNKLLWCKSKVTACERNEGMSDTGGRAPLILNLYTRLNWMNQLPGVLAKRKLLRLPESYHKSSAFRPTSYSLYRLRSKNSFHKVFRHDPYTSNADKSIYRSKYTTLSVFVNAISKISLTGYTFQILIVQGGSNMTGKNCDFFIHKSSRSYLNHLVHSKSWRPKDGLYGLRTAFFIKIYKIKARIDEY